MERDVPLIVCLLMVQWVVGSIPCGARCTSDSMSANGAMGCRIDPLWSEMYL